VLLMLMPPSQILGQRCYERRWEARGVSLKRLLDESPWLQFTSECHRF
jgi:hypothetical protein